jgi:hypothetical protein
MIVSLQVVLAVSGLLKIRVALYGKYRTDWKGHQTGRYDVMTSLDAASWKRALKEVAPQ